jgi:hypothetical protein
VNPWVGWTLAVAAVVAGYWSYGAAGVALGVTVVVFWLLLQFTRAMRVMRQAGAAPLGVVGSAVMLQARLRPGMRMLELLPLAGALGRKLGEDAARGGETFEWRDPSGARLVVELRHGRCTGWRLEREAGADPAAPAAEAATEAAGATAERGRAATPAP